MSDTLHDDLDSLHILPMSIIPFENRSLCHARMIKNARLQSMIELFQDADSGSGQMTVDAAARQLRDHSDASPEDINLLRKLARLPSYDVYSLRISLREQGIPLTDVEALKLSPKKSQELAGYMKDFTFPLIRDIYGSTDVEVKEFSDLLNLFRNPDVKMARDKLDMMAKKLDIDLMELPRFLEDYGDIFLSLAYYKHCLDETAPITTGFLESLKSIRSNWELKSDQNLMKTCEMLEKTFTGLSAHLKRLFQEFDASTKDFWSDVSAERFRQVEALIQSYHTTIGGVLCALSVKMTAWHTLFPRDTVGGPVKRSEFIMLEMRQGIEEVRKILKDAQESKPNPRSRSKFKTYAQGQEERAAAARGVKAAPALGDNLPNPDRF
ncbi:hypothetical protein [Magnetovibrio blakemorei]|uniref:Uncharacterized protein n=1 Tax=Magnetovibrio blakemorei TaxID=28181 RepID=A0A1E5QBD3_9PROT|nr:hypothetical protein [Magnetovibrio blakemorei]OEJ69261.1 hypothetical protein BEN30_04045 [Magnetovibrio blakemorei]